MSIGTPTLSHEAELRNIWNDAISTFEKSSKTKLKDIRLANALDGDPSMDKIEAVLVAYGTGLKTFRKKGESVRQAFKPLLNWLKAIVEPVGEVVSFVGVPAGKAIFVAIANVLKAIDGVSQVYDHLTEVLKQMGDIFSRLQILSSADAITTALRKLYVEVLSQVLVILGFYIKYCDAVRQETQWSSKPRVWLTRSRDLISSATGNTEIKDAIAKLENMGNRIHQTTTTEVLAYAAKNDVKVASIQANQDGKDVGAWLSAPDPTKNQEERRKQARVVPHHGQWLLDLPEFKEWLVTPNGFFWVSANAGVGKSVLFSWVVDYLTANRPTSSTALAFFYFDYRDAEKQNHQKFLASIVNSFGESSLACTGLLQSFRKRTLNASEGDLETLLDSMLSTPEAKILAIDAIDECWKREREMSLLPWLQALSRKPSPGSGSLQIFVTSRPEPDIEEVLLASDDGGVPLVTHRLLLGDRQEHLDTLREFIDTEIESSKFKRLGWCNAFKKKVADELHTKSGSIFDDLEDAL
ncbi:hypothetical protein DL93DRAFT_1667241 [Clavulina sp. PMI_390]|nr:hypothetical protein DL93DRAFT_1667241 [Clavulina sp. PMI_390]